MRRLAKTIVQYQRAYNSIIEKLKANECVLAVMVFGSMVTGDLWDESDIDLFVVANQFPQVLKNIYTEEKGIDIHIKLMNKDRFLNLHEKDLRGGFIHRIFASSRLVFSKDNDITNRYNNGRYYPDLDKERWNMVYLSSILKSIGLCKKYLSNQRIYTAYSLAVRCSEDYAKLYINSVGHMISKDSMTIAMNLNDDFRNIMENLFNHGGLLENVIETSIKYFSEQIDNNIKNITLILIEYMKNSKVHLSAEDVKNDTLFQDYDIEIEEILNELWKKNIIKRGKRDYFLNEGNKVLKENVYFI